MGGDNQDLNLTIRAKDEATDTIKKVQKSLTEVTGAQEKAGKSSDGMATSVFKGVLAYDALKQGVTLAIGFLKDSIGESMEASRVMAQVETNVKNAGFAYEKLAPKIKEYSEAALHLGFDDETAAQSLSKLLLVTKDYEQARALVNLSMDLAANKNIGLEEATKAIIMVTQGNTKALKEYGIELGDTATTAEILIEAQNKLKDAALNASKTSAGEIKKLKEEYSNLKQQIGDAVTPVLMEFVKAITDNMPVIISAVEGVITVFEKLFKVANLATGRIFEMLGAVSDYVNATNDATDATLKYNLQISDIVLAYNKLNKGQGITVEQYNKMAWEEQRAIIRGSNYKQTLGETSNALGKVANKAESAGKSIEKLQKIASGKQDIASEIVDQEKNIADITEAIRSKTVEQEKASKDATVDLEQQYQLSQEIFKLQADKVKEEEALARVKNSGLKIDTQIAEANRRSGLTDFERRIEDISANNFGVRSIVPAGPQAPTGNVFNINFNSTVAGDEGVKKIIKDTINSLNRSTSLKTMGGA